MVSEAQASPYRQGAWTVTQLKEELKQRNLSPAGKKDELIERLQRFEEEQQTNTTPRRRHRDHSKARSASKKRSGLGRSASLLEDGPKHGTPRRGRPHKAPLMDEWISTPLRHESSKLAKSSPRHLTPTTHARLSSAKTAAPAKLNLPRSLGLGVLVAAIAMLAVPFLLKTPCLDAYCQKAAWYARWAALGFVGCLWSNTWLKNLGPFIARVASSAYVCKSTALNVLSMIGAIACPKEPYVRSDVGPLGILAKVSGESASWGLGGVVAELVPYLLATVFVKALKAHSQHSVHAQRLMALVRRVRKNFGPKLAVLFAAFPHPLVEATGLLGGLAGLPCVPTLGALLAGTVVLRCGIQALLVISIYSKAFLDPLLAFVKDKVSPRAAQALYHLVTEQRNQYQQPPASGDAMGLVRTSLNMVNLSVLVFMAVYSLPYLLKAARTRK